MAEVKEVHLKLPEWAVVETMNLRNAKDSYNEVERVQIVNRFAKLNTENNTGGPFAAAIFERDSGKLLVAGVNRVVPTSMSAAHAEVTVLSVAQQMLGTFDLGGKGLPAYQLVVNWRPCTMCFGAVIWSGVRSLLLAGYGQEVEEITGFDEGPIPGGEANGDNGRPLWMAELEKRGIEVKTASDELRNEAIEGFKFFRDSGSLVYNGRLGD